MLKFIAAKTQVIMLDWDNWSAVLSVARAGTIAGGAESLRLDATTVSRRIKALEVKLGAKLFFRDGRRHMPTARCRTMLDHLEQAASSINAAHQSGDADPKSKFMRTLRISAPPFFTDHILAPNVHRLLKERAFRVELLPTFSPTALIQGEVDLALVVDDRPKGTRWDNSRVTAMEIGQLPYRVYHEKSKEPDDLPWAGLRELPDIRTGGALMAKLAGPHGLQFQVTHFEALAQILVSGVAMSLLPEPVAKNHPTLRACSEVLLAQPIFLLSKKEDVNTTSLSICKSWIVETLNQELNGQRYHRQREGLDSGSG